MACAVFMLPNMVYDQLRSSRIVGTNSAYEKRAKLAPKLVPKASPMATNTGCALSQEEVVAVGEFIG
jgi:hypothetical protein